VGAGFEAVVKLVGFQLADGDAVDDTAKSILSDRQKNVR
jgi:hypothetical protein